MAEITRRRLIGAAAVGAAGTAAGVAPGAAAGRTRVRRVDVAVVGAGLAGLTAARALRKAGRSVIVLEARDRVGGRTLNTSVGGKEITELGGEYVGPTQDRILALAKAVGVKTFLTYNEGENVQVFDGVRSTYPATGLPTQPDVAADIPRLLELQSLANEVPVDAPWRAPRAVEWDSQTLETWIQGTAKTKAGKAAFQAAVTSSSAPRRATSRCSSSCSTSPRPATGRSRAGSWA